MQALETARCIEENVLTDVREADVGSILGFGFAPFSGGTLSYIDMMGTPQFVALCERLEEKYGERFKPSKLLRDMAATDDTFYHRFGPTRPRAAAIISEQPKSRAILAYGALTTCRTASNSCAAFPALPFNSARV